MKFLIITHVFHKFKEEQWFAYEPYVREMNLWLNYVDEVNIVAPVVLDPISEIDLAYKHEKIRFKAIPSIEFTSFIKSFESLIKIPVILYALFKACKQADHIHLRCPGNIGLLGCFVQIFFPKKSKTAKYAGNWDYKAKQPLSYKLQKWILSHTLLTKNMQVLVYGTWSNQSKNIKPFFTASFRDSEKEPWVERTYGGALKFVFVGSLSSGKQPDVAIKIIEALYKQKKNVTLDIFGDGILSNHLRSYIENHKLDNVITLHGNTSLEGVKEYLKSAHFLLLPSKSEGWPKAVAEAMFFGAIPVATKVSCVPYMLDYGNRGILIDTGVDEAVSTINEAIATKDLPAMSKLASQWSQHYTLDYFESEIKKLLIH